MGISNSFPVVQLPRDRIVVVTGANLGIGYEIAKWSAMMGATVIMACRSEERAKDAMYRMNAEFNAEKARGTTGDNELSLEYMQLRLDSFKSVMAFVETFKSTVTRAVLQCWNCFRTISMSNTSGIYFVDFTRTTPSSQPRNEKSQELLWKESFEFIKQFVT